MANMARDLEKEQYLFAYDKDREQINYQPYRSTPLISPGPKVKRDTPIVASYLNMHPDPQVRGAAPHITQVSGLNTMLSSANEQLARKVATQVKTVAGARPTSDRVDTGRSPKIIHHQFNTPAGLYSSENMASSLHQQTGIAPSMGGPRREFNLQNSETLKMIMEEDSQKPAVQQKPKSHVVYDVHEAKRGVWPPPDLREQKRTLPPPGERPVRDKVEEPNHDLPDTPAINQPPSMFSNSEKIAQSYTFNKLMWTVDPLEHM